RDGAIGTEIVGDTVRIYRLTARRCGDLHNHVEVGNVVVHDTETDAVLVDPGRDLHVRLRRLQQPAGVVVQQYLARLGEAGECEDAAGVTASDCPGLNNDSGVIHCTGEAHLTAPCQPDRRTHYRRRLRAQSCCSGRRGVWYGHAC